MPSSTSVQRELRRLYRSGKTRDADGSALTHKKLLELLTEFGAHVGKRYSDFKSDEQELAVLKVLAGQDALALMPTGSGKSLIYQFTAWLARPDLTLVVSPLRALMKQQAAMAGAETIHGEIAHADREGVWDRLTAGESYILLVSPEKLAARDFRNRLSRVLRKGKRGIARFVVDEVHCVSDWGHDFRPHYWWVAHNLHEIEADLPVRRPRGTHIPRVLLTATADSRVLDDIRHHFDEIEAHELIRAPMGREELVLSAMSVESAAKRQSALARFLKRQATRALPDGVKRRGIIFNLEAVSSDEDDGRAERRVRADRLKADQVVEVVRRAGFRETYPFTARNMRSDQRNQALDAFRGASTRPGTLTTIVATSAFGMGMDFENVPFVLHMYPRPTVSEYWQQVGRAGREIDAGEAWAECLALYSPDDWAYVLRIAKKPALDGLLNAFTMPLHSRMFVWKRSAWHMSLQGPGGRRTKFSRLVDELIARGILDSTPRPVKALGNGDVVSYDIDVARLKRNDAWEGKNGLFHLRNTTFRRSKRLRKVFRYLAVASRSRRGRFIVLNQRDYNEDKAGTVLSRLNRWIDSGYLSPRSDLGGPGEIYLEARSSRLTDAMVDRIRKVAEEWARHKTRQIELVRQVFAAHGPAARRNAVLQHFGEPPDRTWTAPSALPPWLRE